MEHGYDTVANAARHRAVRYRCDMDPALAAVLGISGWIVAVISLGWNVTQFFLTGARVRVALGTRVFGTRIQTASSTAPPRWRRWPSMDAPLSHVPFGIVLLTVTIYNGRLPVTIDSITAKSGKHGIAYADEAVPLPYELAPHTSVTWTMLLSGAEGQAKLAKRNRFHVVVALGNGKKYKSRPSYNVNGPRPQPADPRWFRENKPEATGPSITAGADAARIWRDAARLWRES